MSGLVRDLGATVLRDPKWRCTHVTDENFPEDRPATALFPQFETELYRMISTEVEGLTESQLDSGLSRIPKFR